VYARPLSRLPFASPFLEITKGYFRFTTASAVSASSRTSYYPPARAAAFAAVGALSSCPPARAASVQPSAPFLLAHPPAPRPLQPSAPRYTVTLPVGREVKGARTSTRLPLPSDSRELTSHAPPRVGFRARRDRGCLIRPLHSSTRRWAMRACRRKCGCL
jgi:hypothetical protein